MSEPRDLSPNGSLLALVLVFCSGFAALVYQVLWMKQIGLLFGNTSQAAAVTLATLFAGLAVGSKTLGRRVSSSRNPLRTFAFLELGIAATAFLYFVVLALYQSVYPAIYRGVGPGGGLLMIKFALSLVLVFPPAFCMGGTIPVLGQFMVRQREAFGRVSALMYGVNTLGAAFGAALAGFYLPLWLGFNFTCGLAILVSTSVGLLALRKSRGLSAEGFSKADEEGSFDHEPDEPKPLTRQQRRQQKRDQQEKGKAVEPRAGLPQTRPQSGAGRWAVLLLCFLSGFGVLALEVVWTRLFSQVLENSVYTFAAILVVVLVSLALGALLSSCVSRSSQPPTLVLTILLLVGAGALMVMPTVFLAVTDGMQLLTSKSSWGSHMLLVFRATALVIGPPALLLGTIFPYLMKVEERYLEAPGSSLGRLAAANTIGAILGALLCGFVLLDAVGMWRSVQLVTLFYLLAAVVLPFPRTALGMGSEVAAVALILLNLLVFDFKSLPVVASDPDRPRETVLEVWEGSDCTVSVTEGEGGRAIRINSDYSLGSTGAYPSEKFQADLPLMIYPETKDLFFLGLGTGITAGSALDRRFAVEQLVACELVPEVVTAAQKYMTDVRGFDATGGLFRDRRARILVEDGRHHLMATDERYDMINADLFVPFRSGAGSLYTLEHFQNARGRLVPGGVFVQWLPLHQLTEKEFLIISRTMVEAFAQVSMWRHNFQPGYEMVALIGHQEDGALPASVIDSRVDKQRAVDGKSHRDLQRLQLPLDPQTILLFYGGNLTAARSLFEGVPLNTDDRPVIEYLAPRTYREGRDEDSPWFLGAKFADFVEKVQALCPPTEDPLLAKRTAANRRLPLAGSAYHRARLAEVRGDEPAARRAWEEFVREWTDQRE